MKRNLEVFGGIRRLEPGYKMRLTGNPAPAVHFPRNIPANLEERVEKSTKWVNSLAMVEKLDDKLRLCLDPKGLNKAIKRENHQLSISDEIPTRLTGAGIFSKLDSNHGYWQISLDEASQC